MKIRDYTPQTPEEYATRDYVVQKSREYAKYCLKVYDLQDEDIEDLKQELLLKALQLVKNPKLHKGTDITVEWRKAYCFRIFKNFVINWHRDRKNKKMRYEDPQTLYDALKDYRYDDKGVPYDEIPVLSCLNSFEQKIIYLKYFKNCSNKNIIKLLDHEYSGSEAGLRQILSRVRIKLAKKYPYLVKNIKK